MVTPGIEKALIDSPSHKVVLIVLLFILCQIVGIEDLRKSVFLVLEPKLLSPLHIGRGRSEGVRLRSIDDLIGVVIEGPDFLFDLPNEPIMPALKPIVRSLRVAFKVLIVDPLQGSRREPPSFLPIHMLERSRGLKHLGIAIEDELQIVIDFGNAEEEPSMLSIEQVEDHTVVGDSS